MNFRWTMITGFFLLGTMLFSNGEGEPLPEPYIGAETGARIQLHLEPGPDYSLEVNRVVFSYTVWPQVAVWLETPQGEFLETIYVTQVVVDQDFTAAPKEGRPEALPVWTHLAGGENVDAVTSATTVGEDVRFGNSIAQRLEPGRYIVKLETNRSYDWNEVYTKKVSGVNGQPSVVYQAELLVGEEEQRASFRPMGT
jgi:hypothetical protein